MAVTCSGEWPCITLVLGFAEGARVVCRLGLKMGFKWVH